MTTTLVEMPSVVTVVPCPNITALDHSGPVLLLPTDDADKPRRFGIGKIEFHVCTEHGGSSLAMFDTAREVDGWLRDLGYTPVGIGPRWSKPIVSNPAIRWTLRGLARLSVAIVLSIGAFYYGARTR